MKKCNFKIYYSTYK